MFFLKNEILLNEILAFSTFQREFCFNILFDEKQLTKKQNKSYEKRVCLLNEKEQNFDFLVLVFFKKQKDDREEEKGKERKKVQKN